MSDEESTAPEDAGPAEDDALEDADIKSGTGDAEQVNPTREGEAKPASGFTPEAGVGEAPGRLTHNLSIAASHGNTVPRLRLFGGEA